MMAFNPADHFRNLKGQKYLETKHRLTWALDENPGADPGQPGTRGIDVTSQEVFHEPVQGIATFHARAEVFTYTEDGVRLLVKGGEGNGSETRTDFGDYYEKAATKALGRAMAAVGYGTQFAVEMEEDERNLADAPVDARTAPAPTQSPAPQAKQPPPLRPGQAATPRATPVPDDEMLRTRGLALLGNDSEAAEIMKGRKVTLQGMTGQPLEDTVAWLEKRVREGKNVAAAGAS